MNHMIIISSIATGIAKCPKEISVSTLGITLIGKRRETFLLRPLSPFTAMSLAPTAPHGFPSISEALRAVTEWHKDEMEHDYSDETDWGDLDDIIEKAEQEGSDIMILTLKDK